MFDLERLEKKVLVFLLAALLIGAGIIAYKKLCPTGDLSIERFSAPTAPSDGKTLGINKKVNINNASADQLMALKGVGKIMAQRIVEYRQKKGLFISPEDIKKVAGIGDKLFSKIKDSISLE